LKALIPIVAILAATAGAFAFYDSSDFYNANGNKSVDPESKQK
jgi:hypothetical protein|tara:strand:- start:1239 stop:1367 length:129 start_codon:yes stop_codon:yes gene_type:complete